MNAFLANTIWAPLFVYHYDTASTLVSFVIGFVAECAAIRVYTRSVLPIAATLRRLILANLVSYVVGHLILIFVPLDIHKSSLGETVFAFFLVSCP